jgi:hypothetical protein
VVFCNEIKEFVTAELMRDWWNHGVHEKSLSTYCFLVQCNIPDCMGHVRPKKWNTNIHGMLRCIPTISPMRVNYFDSIDSKLSVYENFEDAPMLLELAIWILKITQQLDWNNDSMKMQCHTDSLSMVSIIVPNVLSFLTDDKNKGKVVVGGDDNSDSNVNMEEEEYSTEDDDDSDNDN